MTKRPATDPIDLVFAETDRTDAILVVERKKLHVNKALLSCHSDYFHTLFNSDFKEKSLPEIEIKDVKFEDFATLLSLVQKNPIAPTAETAESILKLADRFMLPAAKRHVEPFLMVSEMKNLEKLELADKYDLNFLLVDTLKKLDKYGIRPTEKFSKFSDKTKARVLDRMIELN
ncbi:hypothetical protein B9Z55_004822 [Caenorhabditis nigoni]|uniref:BTB domain-containing protein n=1 Tax=Caenorhabditis nigoni TaxID=1611254 RepID=A0A2G5UY53_9PELO|nr:hypothetical protein B9Z55_004822 [Caenorhabditis nigoni]